MWWFGGPLQKANITSAPRRHAAARKPTPSPPHPLGPRPLQRTMEIINDIMEKAKEDVKKLIEKVQVRAG